MREERHIARSHARDCSRCAGQEDALARVDAVLGADEVTFDASAASRRLLLAAKPHLAAYAQREYVRRVAVSLLLASAPLPAVVACGYLAYQATYVVLASLLPGTIAAWFVTAHVAVALLLLAAAYAAIPLLVNQRAIAGGTS